MGLQVGHTSPGVVTVVEVCTHSGEGGSLERGRTRTVGQGVWSGRAGIDRESCRRVQGEEHGQGEGCGLDTVEMWGRG